MKSSRNVYLKISGVVMMWSLIVLQLPGFQNKYVTIWWLVLYNIFQAIGDVVGDAIMVTWARKDPVYGSGDLQMIHVVSVWIGGISGSIIASYANVYFHPFVILRGFWVTSIMFTVLAYWIEEIQVDQFVSPMENIKQSFQHISTRIVSGTLIFLLITWTIIPSFGDIMYYWMINELEFSKRTIALLTLIAYCTASFGTLMYNSWLKYMEYRHIMILAHFIFAFSWATSYLLVSRISKNVLHMNDIFFSFFTEAAADILYVAFIAMPTLVLQTKIVPKNIEATVYSFFTSFQNLANNFLSPIIGGMIANLFHVSKDDFTYFPTVLLIQIGTCFIPIWFIWLLPTNKEIDDYYENVIKSDSETQNLINTNRNEFSVPKNLLMRRKAPSDSISLS